MLAWRLFARYGALMPEPDLPPNEVTRRVRAAWAYSGAGQQEFAERLAAVTKISAATWRGYLGKSRTNAPSAPEVLDAIAAISGAPAWFMRHGWEGWLRETPADGEAHSLWLIVAELSTRIFALEDAAKETAVAADPAGPTTAALHLQEVAQNLQERARQLIHTARDAAASSSE